MTPSPTETPSLRLDPAAIAALQRATIDALPPHPGASAAETQAQHDGALAFLAALGPRDLMQATLAIRIVTTHHAAMECFRRAARDNLPAALHARVVGKAVALCRLMDAAVRDLGQRQASRVAQPAALPAAVQAAVQAARARPAPEAAQASTPAQPPAAEGRHERRRRERAERRLAAAMQRAGLADARAAAMQQRLVAEAAARSAVPAQACAA